jgi:4,5-DOPA dioxygenase extradiol
MSELPVLFVAHGAPPLALDREKGAQLARWASSLPRPRSILAISPHWQTRDPTIGATTELPLLYDFNGFSPLLHEIRYPYPAAPALAVRVEQLLGAKMNVGRSADRKIDHGIWVPLKHMYPAADVPLLQISLPRRSGDELFAIGKLLAPLASEGTLLVATGNLTHNLRRIDFAETTKTPAWAIDFDAWCADVLRRNDVDALLNYRVRAPSVAMAHPTEEHFLPLLIAAGAASVRSQRVTFPILGFEMTSLSRRCVQFDPM